VPKKADADPVHDPRDSWQILRDELAARRASGHDVDGIAGAIAAADLEADERDPDRIAESDATSAGAGPDVWFDRLERSGLRADWPYDEPSTWSLIETALPPPPPTAPLELNDLDRRLRGAWLGRCVGCMAGKPVEGWSRENVRAHLERTGDTSLRDYVPPPGDDQTAAQMKPTWPTTTRGRVAGVTRDDDIDYTLLGLHLLESRGLQFEPLDVAHELVDHLPFTQVFTAERVAYRNIVDGRRPPDTATYRNPYREWIGALIRADIFGYVCAGRPREAARCAARDASVSHVGNGMYGSMWAAALISAALVVDTPEVAVREALSHVPLKSRLHEALGANLRLFGAGASWETAMDAVDRDLGSYHWVHVLPNAVAIQAAVLWSRGDFATGIGLAVEAGRDTDSTGATVGSVLGAIGGQDGVPAHLGAPLGDLVRSAIAGFDGVTISSLVERTLALVARVSDEVSSGRPRSER
jgi:ADP-ribosylglycohydrolase